MHTTRECGVLDAVPPERRAHSRLEVTRCCSTQQSTHKHTRHTHTHTGKCDTWSIKAHASVRCSTHRQPLHTKHTKPKKLTGGCTGAHVCTGTVHTCSNHNTARQAVSQGWSHLHQPSFHFGTPAARYHTSCTLQDQCRGQQTGQK